MATTSKTKSTKPRKATRARKAHVPAVVSTEAFPATASDKIICAKHIVQSVVAAHDAETLDGQNYDIYWPLSLAVELLEQAKRQVSS